MKFAWFGGSKERIHHILSRGFSFNDIRDNINAAIFLSPDHSPVWRRRFQMKMEFDICYFVESYSDDPS
ncbi:hypothetical protein BVRB_2g034250 [Beta vulgaris subsp. vulgaris]|nr:hypothetical protein BVRB_2g034250 [Beta vulgaris subsp. vulgaris]